MQTNSRAQQRQERAQRAAESRQLRALPPSQRAQRREEFQNARQQRALTRQATPNATPNAARANVQTNALATTQLRGPRRNGQARVTQTAARQGRFAAPFAQANLQANNRSGRGQRFAAGQAWRNHQRASFVPWYGPVFYPYAYSDIFDYAFWPDGYDDGYWAYAYDDFFDGVFFGDAGPVIDDGYAPQATGSTAPPTSFATVQSLCKQPGSGVTAWPIAQIDAKLSLNPDQKALLGDVKNAGDKAAAVFKVSCPAENAFPLTPPGRLAAMTTRLDATLDAVETVRPALDKFFNSLSDEQKERFNALGPQLSNAKVAQANATTGAAAPEGVDAKSCKEQKAGLTNLPIEKIEDAIKPTGAQETQLNNLQDATGKAVSIMQAACPEETPLTPPGRLEAMATRLKAMIEAANTVKPALVDFYGSLSNEQKARFDRIGSQLAQAKD